MWKVGRFNDKWKPRVLICDDDSHVGGILNQYLSSVGFHTEQAKDSFECIDFACLRHPDVILLDLDMPEFDGHRTMQQLRKLGINIPVILFSAGVATPFDDDSAVLRKPFRPKEIAIILETLLLETKKEKRFIPRRYKVH